MAGNYDILGGVQYDPRYDDNQSIALMQGAMKEKSNQYDSTKSSMLEASGILGSEAALYARDPDKAFLQQKLSEIQDIPDFVTKKYNGDYAAARFDIANKIQHTKQYFDQAKQAYEAEQKVNPIYRKLSVEGKLIEDGNPHNQSIFDERGNYKGSPTYNPIERPDYDAVIREGLVKGIDGIVKESGLSSDNAHMLLQSVTNGGLGAITNLELRSRVESYMTNFLGQTPFMKDKTMSSYWNDPSKFVEESVIRQANSSKQRNWREDTSLNVNLNEDNQKAFINMPVITDKSELIKTPLADRLDNKQDKISDLHFKTTNFLNKNSNFDDTGKFLGTTESKIKLGSEPILDKEGNIISQRDKYKTIYRHNKEDQDFINEINDKFLPGTNLNDKDKIKLYNEAIEQKRVHTLPIIKLNNEESTVISNNLGTDLNRNYKVIEKNKLKDLDKEDLSSEVLNSKPASISFSTDGTPMYQHQYIKDKSTGINIAYSNLPKDEAQYFSMSSNMMKSGSSMEDNNYIPGLGSKSDKEIKDLKVNGFYKIKNIIDPSTKQISTLAIPYYKNNLGQYIPDYSSDKVLNQEEVMQEEQRKFRTYLYSKNQKYLK